MPLDHHIEDAQARITLRLVGLVRGKVFSGFLVGLLEARPELTGYDFLYDLLAYEGDVAAADVEPVADTYHRLARPGAVRPRTCFVTRDSNFRHWAAALDHQFPDRDHRVFEALEAGQDWLAEGRGGA